MLTVDADSVGAPGQRSPDVTFAQLTRPFLRCWRLVLASVGSAWVLAALAVLLPSRRFTAEVTLAAVPSARMPSLAGGLTSLLGSAQLGGVQSTPYFISKLLLLRGVLAEVAAQPVDGGRERVIERVLEQPVAQINPGDIVPAMRDLLAADVDKQTGLVTFAVTHTDSALARRIADAVVTAAATRYRIVLRAQAAEQRRAGEALVDSAQRQLRRAEDRLQAHQASHRIFESYSVAALERSRLEQERTEALDAYGKAMSERQAAIARELEDSPAVVVVDPVPEQLTPRPRQGLLKLVLASAFGLVAATLLLALRGEFRREFRRAD